MAAIIGTYSLADLQAATGAGEINEEAVTATLQAETAAANAAVREQLGEIAVITTDVRNSYGTQASGEMTRADDFGRAPTQKGSVTGETAYPFEKWIYATGWTEDFRRKASPAKYAETFVGARRAYIRAIQKALKNAIFGSANFSFTDYMDSKLVLPVKRFANADGAPIKEGPNSEVFDGSTHTHYSATASLTATQADALASNVVEHGYGSPRIYINQANEATWTALTGFVRAQPSGVIVADNVTRTARPLDTSVLTNRFVGLTAGGVEVYTKPWIPPSYAFAFDAGSPDKPLAVREDIAGSSGLALGQLLQATPLSAQHYAARFGVGVKSRTNGAVLYFGGGSYVDFQQA